MPSEASPPTRSDEGQRPGGLLHTLRHRDHTRGSLFVSLAALALPLLATSLVGAVAFQTVDLKLVSGLGEDALTAVVVTNQSLRQLFFMLVMGASFGAQGLIARSVGQGSDAADHVAGQTVMLGLMLSAAVAVIGVSIPGVLLGGMNVSDAVLQTGIPYVRLVFALNFGFVFINLFNAILNGAGDTATPFLIALVTTSLGLMGEWTLIYGHFGLPALGIRGVVLGAFAGQLAAIFIMSRVLFGGSARVHVRLRHMKPDWPVMREIISLAWPPALQMIGGFLVTVFFIRLMGDFGDKAQAAYSIGLRLGMLGPMICFPVAGAVATLVGQAIGASDTRRAWRAMGVGLLVHCTMMWTIALLFFVYRVELIHFFSQDPAVIAIGERMMAWQSAQFFMMGFMFVFMRSLQGAGDVVVPMALSLANSVLISLPLGYYLSMVRGLGPDGLFFAQFIGVTLSAFATGSWVATGRWTTARKRAMARMMASHAPEPSDRAEEREHPTPVA